MTATIAQTVHALRADPNADIDQAVSDQAGPLTERLMARASLQGMRALSVDLLAGIYAAIRKEMKIFRAREAALMADTASHRSVALTALHELDRIADMLDATGDRDALPSAEHIRDVCARLAALLDLDDLTAPNPRPNKP